MSWNYQVIKYADPDEGYGLHELHYDANGEVVRWTERGSVVGNTRESIVAQLLQMRVDAKHRPIFDEAEWQRNHQSETVTTTTESTELSGASK